MKPRTTKNIITALQAGAVIAEPTTWKNNTSAVTAIATVLTVILGFLRGFGIDLPFTDTQILAGAGLLWSLIGAGNVVSTVITSAKVGWKKEKK